MAKETLDLEVKSNISSVAKDTDAFAKSLAKVNDEINDTNRYIIKQEKDLIKLKAKQDAIPKGAWVAGMDKLNGKIKKTSTNIKESKNSLKGLKEEQKLATKELKKNTQAQKTNEKATKEGIGSFTLMGVSLNGIKAGFAKIIPMAKAMFATVKAGIISTGIGALVLAVISLFSYFTKTQRGAEMLQRAMAGLGAVMDVLTDLFSSAGETIVGVFTDPKKAIADLWEYIKTNMLNRLTGLVDGFKAAGKLIQSALKFDWDGVKEASLEYGQALVQVGTGMDLEQQKAFTDGIKKIGKEMNEEAAAAMRLKGVMQDIRREEMEFTKVQAQTRQDVAKARLLAMDESKTQEERLKAINSVMEKELKMTAGIIEMQKKKIAAKREENSLGESMIEDKEALAQLEVQLIDLTTQSTMTQKRLMLEVETLTNEMRAKAKAEAKKLADAKKILLASEKLDLEAFTEWNLQRIIGETDAELKIRMKAASDSATILQTLRDENFLAEIENLQERALAELDIQQAKELEALSGYENFTELKIELDKKYDRARDAIGEKSSKEEVKRDKFTTKQKVKAAGDGFGQLSKIMGEETKAGKAAAIAQATIQTYLGATQAFTSLSSIPVVGPVLGGIAAAAAIVAGFKNIQAIKSGSSGGGGGGGGGSAGGGSSPSPAPPSPQMMSGAFELGGGQEVEPSRAYVVSDDITASQNGLEVIRRRATI